MRRVGNFHAMKAFFGRIARTSLVLGSCLVVAVAVAACGVRGSLDLPPEAKAKQNTATADSGQGKAAGVAAKPHKPFILDGLLQ